MPLPVRSELAQKVHQLNNLLSIIQGYAELLILGGQDGEESAEMLREISRASDQASALTVSLPGL